MHARIYDLSLSAGETEVLPVVGRFFQVLSATGRVRVRTNTNLEVDLLAGQGVRDFHFQELQVRDLSGGANLVYILAGDAPLDDRRVTGEVSIIDGGRARTLANLAFMRNVYVPAAAAQTSYAQLWNPVGSGRRVNVTQVWGASAGAGGLVLSIGSAQGGGGATTGTSKLGGGATGSGVLYGTQGALPASTPMFSTNIVANGSINVRVAEPIMLPPGYGLTLNHGTVNSELAASFEWFEEAV
jgi:hypothetical protein